MRRAFISICAALGLVLMLANPASAAVTIRHKSDHVAEINCGPGNDYDVDSWVGLRDQGTSGEGDDEIDYTVAENGVDVRVVLDDHTNVDWFYVALMKRKADGTGQLVHFDSVFQSPQYDSTYIDFTEFANYPGNIARDRKPWLHVRVQFDNGSTSGCVSKTAYFDNWVP